MKIVDSPPPMPRRHKERAAAFVEKPKARREPRSAVIQPQHDKVASAVPQHAASTLGEPKSEQNLRLQAFLAHRLSAALLEANGQRVSNRDALSGWFDGEPEDEVQYLENEVKRCNGNTLYTVKELDDIHLMAYLERMAPAALMPAGQRKLSLHSIPLMLGGMSYAQTHEQAVRALNLMFLDVPGTMEDNRQLRLAMRTSGVGAPISHADVVSDLGDDITFVNPIPGEDMASYEMRIRRTMNVREAAAKPKKQPRIGRVRVRHQQEWLYQLCELGRNFTADLVAGRSLYDVCLKELVSSIKVDVCVRTALLFHTDVEVSDYMAKFVGQGTDRYRALTVIDDYVFARALNRALNNKWVELDVHGTTDHLSIDVEVVLARAIIRRLHSGNGASAKPVKVPTAVVLGMSLLSGVPVSAVLGNLADESMRRGGMIVEVDAAESIMDALQMSELTAMVTPKLAAEMKDIGVRLRAQQQSGHFESTFNSRLRTSTRLMWSMHREGSYGYHYMGTGEDDKPVMRFHNRGGIKDLED